MYRGGVHIMCRNDTTKRLVLVTRPLQVTFSGHPVLKMSVRERHLKGHQGFMVGRTKTSLTNEVPSCVTSMATTFATSPGWIILLRSFELLPLPK